MAEAYEKVYFLINIIFLKLRLDTIGKGKLFRSARCTTTQEKKHWKFILQYISVKSQTRTSYVEKRCLCAQTVEFY